MSTEPDNKALGLLLLDALRLVSRIVSGEITLAKAEIAGSLRQIALGIGLLVGAAIFSLVALFVLSIALTLGLIAAGLQPWLAALLVGGALLLLALILAAFARHALAAGSLFPSRLAQNLKRDLQTLTAHIS
jgi:hypothetical protein